MLLHELKPNHPLKKRKTQVGRGGKRGTTSGHGTKGQKSRSGRRIRPAVRDYIQRLPKLRGQGNLPLEKKFPAMNVGSFERLPKNVTEISVATLGRKVKILGSGEILRPFTVKGFVVSKQAKAKIEKAGGRVL